MQVQLRKGRGATLNPAGRFERQAIDAFDDGWGSMEELALDPPPPTVIGTDTARTAITYNRSPDVGFDRSVNAYQGCEHGCIYCYARPSHSYWGLSPGLDFETRIFARHDAATRLKEELAAPGYRPRPIALGANTDPYQPIERRLLITRRLIETLVEARHPFGITTKSAGILRDLDLLEEAARHQIVRVDVSLTTLDPTLARRMEPRAAAPHRRLDVVRTLTRRGIPVGVNLAPMIPGLNDHEIEPILAAAARAGAWTATGILVRLPHEVKDLFLDWLRRHYPLKAERVISLIRQCRDGRLNDPEFGSRMAGTGPVAELTRLRFTIARRKNRLEQKLPPPRSDRFRPPRLDGQLSLF